MDGKLIDGLMEMVDRATGKTVPRSGDHFDDLTTAKLSLADRIAEEMVLCEKDCTSCEHGACEKFKLLWHEADRLQNRVIKDGV